MGANREAVWAVVVVALVALLVAVLRPQPEATPSPVPSASQIAVTDTPSIPPTPSPAESTPQIAETHAPPLSPPAPAPRCGRVTMGGVALGMTQAEADALRSKVRSGESLGACPVGIAFDDHNRVVWCTGNTIERGGVAILHAGDSYQKMVERLGPPSSAEAPPSGVRDYHYQPLQLTVRSFKGPWVINDFSLGTYPFGKAPGR